MLKENIKANAVGNDDVLAWKRYIELEYEGETCSLTLYWDEHDGYEILWRSDMPSWAQDWEDEDESLGSYLDGLTWEVAK